jgi:hypothetical protein
MTADAVPTRRAFAEERAATQGSTAGAGQSARYNGLARPDMHRMMAHFCRPAEIARGRATLAETQSTSSRRTGSEQRRRRVLGASPIAEWGTNDQATTGRSGRHRVDVGRRLRADLSVAPPPPPGTLVIPAPPPPPIPGSSTTTGEQLQNCVDADPLWVDIRAHLDGLRWRCHQDGRVALDRQ